MRRVSDNDSDHDEMAEESNGSSPSSIAPSAPSASTAQAVAPEGTNATSSSMPQLEPSLQCPYCEYTAARHTEMNVHTSRHKRAHKCPFSDCRQATKGFAKRSDLKRHLLTVHKTDNLNPTLRTYRCFANGCRNADRDFLRLDHFKMDLRSQHPEEGEEALVRQSLEWHDQLRPHEDSEQQAPSVSTLDTAPRSNQTQPRRPRRSSGLIAKPLSKHRGGISRQADIDQANPTQISRQVLLMELVGEARCLPCQQQNRRCHVDHGSQACLQCSTADDCVFERMVLKNGRLSEFAWSDMIGQTSTIKKQETPTILASAGANVIDLTGTAHDKSAPGLWTHMDGTERLVSTMTDYASYN